MTWSILARDAGGAFGVAVASRFFAVGALCPHARSGVGALATQALVNPHYARPGLDLLGRGHAAGGGGPAARRPPTTGREHAPAARDRCAGAHGAPYRQRSASTGAAIARATGYSVAGNMLAGPQVLDANGRGLRSEARRMPFAERLLAALDAGEAAGGDKRGKQAAALLVYTTEDYPFLDLARRRPRRADRRAAAPVRQEPRALPAVPRVPAEPGAARRASPTAP